jgi:hypothetical protein
MPASNPRVINALEADPSQLSKRFHLSTQTLGIVKAVCNACCEYANERLHLLPGLDGIEEALASWIVAQPELRNMQIYRGGSHVALLARVPHLVNAFERIAIFTEEKPAAHFVPRSDEDDALGIGADGMLDQERDW